MAKKMVTPDLEAEYEMKLQKGLDENKVEHP